VTSPLPDPLERALRAELRPGERIVFTAQPRPAMLIRISAAGAAVGVAFAIAGAAFAAYAQWSAAEPMRLPGGIPAAAAGIAGVALGLAQATTMLSTLRALRRVAYFVTDRRAGAIHAGASIRVVTWSPEQLATVRLGDGARSPDAVTFAATDTAPRRARRRPMDTLLEGMHGIDRPDEALAAIRAIAPPSQ
jgi:hypothetical protein